MSCLAGVKAKIVGTHEKNVLINEQRN